MGEQIEAQDGSFMDIGREEEVLPEVPLAQSTPAKKKTDQRFECNICQKSYVRKDGHSIKHREESGEGILCHTCYKMFEDKEALKIHMNTHTHLCPHCARSFNKNCHLKEHINSVHEEKRNHPCPYEMYDLSFTKGGDTGV